MGNFDCICVFVYLHVRHPGLLLLRAFQNYNTCMTHSEKIISGKKRGQGDMPVVNFSRGGEGAGVGLVDY